MEGLVGSSQSDATSNGENSTQAGHQGLEKGKMWGKGKGLEAKTSAPEMKRICRGVDGKDRSTYEKSSFLVRFWDSHGVIAEKAIYTSKKTQFLFLNMHDLERDRSRSMFEICENHGGFCSNTSIMNSPSIMWDSITIIQSP